MWLCRACHNHWISCVTNVVLRDFIRRHAPLGYTVPDGAWRTVGPRRRERLEAACTQLTPYLEAFWWRNRFHERRSGEYVDWDVVSNCPLLSSCVSWCWKSVQNKTNIFWFKRVSPDLTWNLRGAMIETSCPILFLFRGHWGSMLVTWSILANQEKLSLIAALPW